MKSIKLDNEDLKALVEDTKYFFGMTFIAMLIWFSIFSIVISGISQSIKPIHLYKSFLATMFYTLPMLVGGIIGLFVISITNKHIVEGIVKYKDIGYRGSYWLEINHIQYKVNKRFWKSVEPGMFVRLHKSNFVYYFIRGEISLPFI